MPLGRPTSVQQVDLRAGSHQTQGRGTIFGFQHVVAQVLQHFHGDHAHQRLVIHHQDGLAARRRPGRQFLVQGGSSPPPAPVWRGR
jgi:hypothetical protein